MKQFFFNCQAKGGTGKSMLTYLQALKNEDNPETGFIDLDSSTKTSTRQLDFLVNDGQPDRLFTVDIFDSIKRIERERLLKILQSFNDKSFEQIYVDFGAPESEQLPPLLKLDFTSDEFKELESSELGVKFIFNVLLCGGTSYQSTLEYLKEITVILKNNFDIVVYANMFTFRGYDQQLDHLNDFVKKSKIKKVIQFGNIETDRASGKTIMDLIRQGAGMEGYKNEWMARTKMKRLLAEI